MHTCGRFKPFERSVINMERNVDDTASHMLEVDYKAEIVKKGGKIEPGSGKYILVRGHKHYIQRENKEEYLAKRRGQKNFYGPFNDYSGGQDRVNDPNDRKDKHIRRKGKVRRDCSADYKYDGKAVPKREPNKPDLRYNVADINKKMPKFIPAELENDPDYVDWLAEQKRAAKYGPIRNIVEDRIDRVAYFEDGLRVWNPQPEMRPLQGVERKRSKSPVRSASRNRNEQRTIEKKAQLPTQRDHSSNRLRDKSKHSRNTRHSVPRGNRRNSVNAPEDFSQKRTIDKSRSRSRSRNTRTHINPKTKDPRVRNMASPAGKKFMSQPVPQYKPNNSQVSNHSRNSVYSNNQKQYRANAQQTAPVRGQRDFYLNNVERYKNMTKKKADFFARPIRTPERSPKKFRPPPGLIAKYKRDDMITQEVRLLQDHKKIIVRDQFRAVDDKLLRDLGILNRQVRTGRGASPLKHKY